MNEKINRMNTVVIRIFIAVVAALLFIPFLGAVHLFDWDEINFAESAREMIVSGDYLTVQINFQTFWEKPPLFIWMQVLSMKLFGINEFAARFPNAICGIISLLVIFNIGRKIRNNLFGLLWVLAYVGSVLPFFYFKSGIIDPWFNLFIFLGIYFLMLYAFPENNQKIRNIVLSATFAGLAVLTKGPVGFLLIALTGGVFLIWVKFRVKVRVVDVVTYFAVLALVGGSWFIVQILAGHFDMVVEFIVYQIRLFQTKDAGHGGFFGYHFVVLFFGVFPSSILALKAFGKEPSDEASYSFMKKWMVILFWVVLILFSIVKTKIVHYSSLAYFPLTFLAAAFVYRAHQNREKWSKWMSATIISLSVLIALPVMLLQFVDKYKNEIINSNLIHDAFAVENLKAEANWIGFEFLPGLLFLLAVVLLFSLTKKSEPLKRAVILWGTTMLFTLSVVLIMVPRIEKYSQNALIEFFKSKAGKNVYVKNIYFKSYATWFYGEIQPPENPGYYDENWLLSGDIDKDVCFVTKIHRAPLLEKYKDIKETGRKNGFVFYERKANK
ncbi:Dolichyl-phosphate-mannose-protein mannosyltransferase [Mariniphaga anaerophila]|uniref:Dolichyl-phosphate-mannose-protein mannosyltransferase n=1 Tax=Mariniphaga anaerophila TaxID=1484053 RepID=A0A1M4W0C7_9BACT|nr:glycosyltransferase family 39 protein [Mariniphaga anaerophila]SHE74721.1 Dolichyl-phosphate-mannose-protein mannosyltransferase [Mariniphaga anaerophila]